MYFLGNRLCSFQCKNTLLHIFFYLFITNGLFALKILLFSWVPLCTGRVCVTIPIRPGSWWMSWRGLEGFFIENNITIGIDIWRRGHFLKDNFIVNLSQISHFSFERKCGELENCRNDYIEVGIWRCNGILFGRWRIKTIDWVPFAELLSLFELS